MRTIFVQFADEFQARSIINLTNVYCGSCSIVAALL